MLNKFLIIKIITSDEQKVDRIASCFTEVPIIKRNKIILVQGKICKHFDFIKTGCVRSYYVTKEGLEKNRLIMFEHSPIIILSNFFSLKTAVEYMETLEDRTK